MANTFKSVGASAVGTTLTTLYTAPALTTSTVIGLSLANVHATDLAVIEVSLTKGATTYYLIKNAPVSAGGTLIVVGGDQKVVVEAGNIIKVRSSVAASIDAVASVLEIS